MTTDRENYFAELLPRVPNDNLLPPWLVKEAGMEEDWEKVEKQKLELNSFARDFRRAFPAESFAGIFQTDSKTGAKKQIKSTDEVLTEAYQWLSRKTKDEDRLAKAILDAATLVDEYAGPIMQMFKNADDTDSADDNEILKGRDDVDDFSGLSGQPGQQLKEQRQSETTAESVALDANEKQLDENRDQTKKINDYLERKRVIAGYGIILNEQSLQLWKKGELATEVDTNDLGGFAAVADEVEALQTKEDVETLFAVAPVSNIQVTEVSIVNPAVTVAQVGNMRLAGLVKAVHKNETCSFLVTGGHNALIGSEIEIPLKDVIREEVLA